MNFRVKTILGVNLVLLLFLLILGFTYLATRKSDDTDKKNVKSPVQPQSVEDKNDKAEPSGEDLFESETQEKKVVRKRHPSPLVSGQENNDAEKDKSDLLQSPQSSSEGANPQRVSNPTAKKVEAKSKSELHISSLDNDFLSIYQLPEIFAAILVEKGKYLPSVKRFFSKENAYVHHQLPVLEDIKKDARDPQKALSKPVCLNALVSEAYNTLEAQDKYFSLWFKTEVAYNFRDKDWKDRIKNYPPLVKELYEVVNKEIPQYDTELRESIYIELEKIHAKHREFLTNLFWAINPTIKLSGEQVNSHSKMQEIKSTKKKILLEDGYDFLAGSNEESESLDFLSIIMATRDGYYEHQRLNDSGIAFFICLIEKPPASFTHLKNIIEKSLNSPRPAKPIASIFMQMKNMRSYLEIWFKYESIAAFLRQDTLIVDNAAKMVKLRKEFSSRFPSSIQTEFESVLRFIQSKLQKATEPLQVRILLKNLMIEIEALLETKHSSRRDILVNLFWIVRRLSY